MPDAIRLVRMPEPTDNEAWRYYWTLSSWQWYPCNDQLIMQRMGLRDPDGVWYWCKSDSEDPRDWREVRVSNVQVDVHAPLNTPAWANGVVWIKNGCFPSP